MRKIIATSLRAQRIRKTIYRSEFCLFRRITNEEGVSSIIAMTRDGEILHRPPLNFEGE